jgi:hypothetical protein
VTTTQDYTVTARPTLEGGMSEFIVRRTGPLNKPLAIVYHSTSTNDTAN